MTFVEIAVSVEIIQEVLWIVDEIHQDDIIVYWKDEDSGYIEYSSFSKDDMLPKQVEELQVGDYLKETEYYEDDENGRSRCYLLKPVKH